jgi:hypothetical protein
MGPRAGQLLATLCVALSVTLYAMCGTDLIGGFCLRTQNFAGPSSIVGPILDMVTVSCDIAGTSVTPLVSL